MSGATRQVLKRAWRSTRARLGGTAAVLIYHRIAEHASDPERLCVTPERFAEQVGMLSRDFNVMPAGELMGLLADGGRLPRRSVAITFDDGYADALHAALPALRAAGVPGTMFVSSGAVDSACEYWWDELEQVCLTANELPEQIAIDAAGARVSASLGADAVYSAESEARHAGWDVTQPPPTARQRLYLQLAGFLKRLAPDARAVALGSLREQCGIAPVRRETHRALTSAEVAQLAQDALAEVGGHTVDHQMLSACSAEEQRHQIADDKRRLEELCGGKLVSFSYPYGTYDDFDADSVRLVRESGYLGACTTDSDAVVAWGDRFRVPRYLPRHAAPADLSATLARWLDGDG